MHKLYAIDECVLDSCELFSHWTQRHCGIESLDLERFTRSIAVAMMAIDYRASFWDSPFIACLFGFLLLIQLLQVAFPRSRSSKKQYSTVRNIRRITGRAERLWFLLTSAIYLLPDIVRLSLWYECITLAMYFEACDDLPPGESTLGRFLRSCAQQKPVGAEC